MRTFIYPAGVIATTALLLFCPQSEAAAPALHVGSDFRQVTVLECTLKALEAMKSPAQDFIHAQIDGSDAWGYDEKSFVMVHAVPIRDGVEIFVLAFGTDDAEAERLRNVIREHVFDGTLAPSRLPLENFPKSYQTADSRRQRGPVVTHWGNFNKVATEPVFQSCARGTMSHKPLQVSVSGTQIVLGAGPTAVVVALGVGLPRGTQVLVIAASADSTEAERLRNDVRTGIVDCSPL